MKDQVVPIIKSEVQALLAALLLLDATQMGYAANELTDAVSNVTKIKATLGPIRAETNSFHKSKPAHPERPILPEPLMALAPPENFSLAVSVSVAAKAKRLIKGY